MKIGIISNPNKAAKIEKIARMFVSVEEDFSFDLEDVIYVIDTEEDNCETLLASQSIKDVMLYHVDSFLTLYPNDVFDSVIVDGKQAVVSGIRWNNKLNMVEYMTNLGGEWVPYFDVEPIINLTYMIAVGDKLYSPLCGDCTCVDKGEAYIIISAKSNGEIFKLNIDGRMNISGEVLLFKNKDKQTL